MKALRTKLPNVRVVRKPTDLPSQSVLNATEWDQLERGALAPFANPKTQLIYLPEHVKMSPIVEDQVRWRMNPSQDMGPRRMSDFADQMLAHEASHVVHGWPWYAATRAVTTPGMEQGLRGMDPDLASQPWAKLLRHTSSVPEMTADIEGMMNAAKVGRDPMVLPKEDLQKLATIRALRGRQSMLAAAPHVREPVAQTRQTPEAVQGWLPEVLKPLASHATRWTMKKSE